MNYSTFGNDGAFGGYGSNPGDPGGTGGAGQSKVAAVVANADAINSVYARGGAGGAGGSGAYLAGGTGGAAGAGGAGGDGKASLTSTVAYAGTASATAYGHGGDGGSAAQPGGATLGAGAAAGLGGAGAATVSVTNTAGDAGAYATGRGGRGGGNHGAGMAGGAGGSVSSVTASAHASTSAYAGAKARGGDGGIAYAPAGGGTGGTGGAGGNATLTNAVSGSSPVRLVLQQSAYGGQGGASLAGLGGAGGSATSHLTFDDPATNATPTPALSGTAQAIGGDAGGGGKGSGAAGKAVASANLTGSNIVIARALAGGGNGGPSIAAYGDGGKGAEAVAMATARGTSPNGYARAYTYGFGGRGGTANGTGRSGGAGGDVIAAYAGSFSLGSALAGVVAGGGTGGNGQAGAKGGNGGNAMVRDTVTGGTKGGALRLHQQASGGNGGSSSAAAGGAGGAASSLLTFNDAAVNTTVSSSVTARAQAAGGNAGASGAKGGKAAAAGSAVAALTLTGANAVAGVAEARGGTGGTANGNGGAGGTATASARVVSTSASGGPTLRAVAYGGAGGTGMGKGYAGGVGGVAGKVTGAAVGAGASVALHQQGGRGGDGIYGADGGAGGGASIVDGGTVRTTTGGGEITQTARGGDGGNGAAGGAGGNASSALRFDVATAGSSQTAGHTIRSSAFGGAGGFGELTPGSAGTATATVAAYGTAEIFGDAYGKGGTGGRRVAAYGSGAVGGTATAAAIALSRANKASATASATGGTGGTGVGAGHSGGVGGTVSAISARAIGVSAAAVSRTSGGTGGNGYSGAVGGAGADATAVNTVGGGALGGTLALFQSATGGTGGGSDWGGGAGGNASSTLTRDDSSSTDLRGSELLLTAEAMGGTGGGSSLGVAGRAGDATVSLSATGPGYINLDGRATGGAGGYGPDGGVGGTASGTVAATGASGYLSKVTRLRAYGGFGGVGHGAGHTAGAGGVVGAGSVTVNSLYGIAALYASGGNGGRGADGATGGAGANVALTDTVDGGPASRYLTLRQMAFGGAGGASGDGIAGVAGTASSVLRKDARANPALAFLSGRILAVGGGGGDGATPTGGGAASAILELRGAGQVSASANAYGGAGGVRTGTGANAAGGQASASVVAESASASATAQGYASARGGYGRNATGAGHTAGAGAGGSVASVTATGGTAVASAYVNGGRGGSGDYGASGGAGGSVSMTDAVTAATRGGAIRLVQIATGGAGGGSADAAGGAGGSAASSLVFDDRANATAAYCLNVRVRATGGAGGKGATTGAGGAGTASATISAANNVTLFVAGTGGGADGGAGGGGTAVGTILSTGPGGVAIALVSAKGGDGATQGAADATAKAEFMQAGVAKATATVTGASGFATATSIAHSAGIVATVTSTAKAPTGMAAGAESISRLDAPTVVSFTDRNAMAAASIVTTTGSVSAALTSAPNIAAMLGTSPAVVGTGALGAYRLGTASGYSYSGGNTWTLNTTTTAGHLVLGLANPFTAAAGFSDMTMTVSLGGSVVRTDSFTDLATAQAFFTDHPLDLGAVSATPALSVSVAFTMSVATDGAGFGFSYVLGLTNPPAVADTTAPLAPSLQLATGHDDGDSPYDGLTGRASFSVVGIAEGGSSVTIYDGSTALATVVAGPAGAFEASFTLADGPHALTAKATDAASNTSAASARVDITIDTAAPPVPSAPDLQADSDFGASATDNQTAARQLLFSGTSAPDTRMRLYIDGTEFRTVRSDATGTWRVLTNQSLLADGTHAVTVDAVDRAGNASAQSAPLTITIDRATGTPGSIDLATASDSGRSSTDNLTRITTPTFTGKGEAGTTVRLYDGVTLVGSATVGKAGDWSIKTSTLSDGLRSLFMQASDSAGATSAISPAFLVTIDTKAPDAPVLTLGTDTGSSSTDRITQATAPLIRGTAEAGSIVTVVEGATVLGTVTVGGTGAFSITSPTLSEGKHSLTARAVDAAGNTSVSSAALSIVVDTTATAPGAPDLVAASDTGYSQTDDITNDTTPTFSGTSEANATVTMLEGATVLGTGTATAGGIWTITSKALAAGVHTITARSVDLAGNASTVSAGTAVTIDLTPAGPTSAPDLAAASDSGTSSTDNLTNVVTPTFTGTTAAGLKVVLFDAGVAIGSGFADGAGAWSVTTSKLASGAHTIVARTSDIAGNLGSSSSGLKVTIDTTPPALSSVPDMAAASDSGASDSDNVTAVTTPVFTGTAEAGLKVTLFDGATAIGSTVASAGGTWSITATTLAPGAHAITARTTDAAGNTGAATAALAVTVDTAGLTPLEPDLSGSFDTGASSTDNVTRRTALTFNGKSEGGATVVLRDGATVIGTGKATAGGSWTIAASAMAEGVHAITASITDLAGNTSGASSALSVTIDTTLPTGTLTKAGPGLFGGTADPLSFVTVLDGATTIGIGQTLADGSWTTSNAYAPGVYSVKFQVTDLAGNAAPASAARTVTVGSSDNDILATAGSDLAGGGAGNDTYIVDNATDVVWESPGEGADMVLAVIGYTLPSFSEVEFLTANSSAGLALGGNELANAIRGGEGADTLTGGGAGDTLFGAGGVDTFRYTSLSDSTAGAGLMDTIIDFNAAGGERLDLSALDANSGLGGDQAFSFIGAAAFSNVAGQLRAAVSGANTVVSADVNGDGVGDFTVQLLGNQALAAGNFVL